jgi:hypothetical protein
MFKKIISSILILTLMTLTACGYNPRVLTQYDADIAKEQAVAQKACYDSQKDDIDTTKMSADQLERYLLVKKLGDANAKLAAIANKESLDPCAKAGGMNVYEADASMAKSQSENVKEYSSFFKEFVKTAAYTAIFFKGFDTLGKMFENSGGKVTVNGDNNELTGVGNKGDAWQIDKPIDNSIHDNVFN